MPLRDHFQSQPDGRAPWGGIHAQWPAIIVIALNAKLPLRYVAAPHVQLGASFEIDIGTLENEQAISVAGGQFTEPGGVATAWAPPLPTLAIETELPEQDEYEVRIVDVEDSRRLVAAIELVSPANKDRPDHRRAFAAKCATLLQQGVSVSIVDVVTTRQFNLYSDVLDMLGQADPLLEPVAPSLYAATCRWRHNRGVGRLETWVHELTVGRPLPTLPLWLDVDLAMPLELETTYEQTCRSLRIR